MKKSILFLVAVAAGCACGAGIYDITQFGAHEGDELQTAAIQRAIDAAFKAGGGEVRVPEGVFRTGCIRLRSGVTLHLMGGATLEGSRNPEDYEDWKSDAVEPVPPMTEEEAKRSRSTVAQSRWCNGLVRAYRAHDIAIVGEPHSTINGMNCFDAVGEEKYRGPHAISMWYCTNVVLRGYAIRDSANWAHAIFVSSNIVAEAVRVYGGHDGFDVRTCDDVRVERCVFKTGDDAIAGFDNIGVAIRDCVLDAACSALRFGGTDVLIENCRGTAPAPYGHRWKMDPEAKRLSLNDGRLTRHNMYNGFLYYCDNRAVIRRPPGNILMRNCVFRNADRIFSLEFDGRHIWCCNRSLNSIVFENCTFDGVCMPLFVHGDAKEPLALTMRGCTVSARAGCGQQPVADVRNFSRIAFTDTTWRNYAAPRLVARTPGDIAVKGGTPVEVSRPAAE